jgi:hypothetical protein
MKKNNTRKEVGKKGEKEENRTVAIGMDVGSRDRQEAVLHPSERPRPVTTRK